MKTCADLFHELNELDEHDQIEAKKGSDAGNSLMETICAYANEPGLGGGYILLGVSRCADDEGRYCAVGVSQVDKVLQEIATQCANRFNTPIRPRSMLGHIDGKTVIGIYIAEAPPGDKPVYFKKLGLPLGAYRRIGSTDHRCTSEDIELLYRERRSEPYDLTIIPYATTDDIDPDAVLEYRRLRGEADPKAEELTLDDTGLLLSLNCLREVEGVFRPTVCGILLFGKRASIRRIFPMNRLDYIRVVGREWISDPDHPFDTIEMQDPIIRLVSRAVAAVMDDIPTAFSFTDRDIQRHEEPRIPKRVIREALVNALMHRNYRSHSPVQVIRYSNRIEVRNQGYSLKPVELLGQPGSVPRNPTIASVLHDTKQAETKGSGIRVMREFMLTANLSPPTFDSRRDHDQFTATFLLHHFLDSADIGWLECFKDEHLSDDEARILIHAREMGQVSNAVCRDYTGLDTLGVSRILKRLRNIGLIEQHAHGQATFYTPTMRLIDPESYDTKRSVEESKAPNTIDLSDSSSVVVDITPELSEAIQKLGLRSPPAAVQKVIAQLCEVRPFTQNELAVLLHRSKRWITEIYIKPMLRDGIVELVYPDAPSHPQQAYRTRTLEEPR